MRILKYCGRGLLPLLLVTLVSGCFAPKSYVDPNYRRATYATIQPKAEPIAIQLELRWQTNGKEAPRVVPTVRPKISRILRVSGVVSDHAALPNSPRLVLVINNIANLQDAAAKGFVTGLTFGGAGSEVMDGYAMSATFTPSNGASITKSYKHAIHSTFGAKAAPKGVELVATEVAIDRVLEDMLLNLLEDLQKEKLL